ncbi:MAG: hypothetical protein K9M99_13260 [Candidatus Cloacimonetes bacterium]|nr:hypothetical protein [Candidatus Cloacimonadota bacterium]
MKKIILILLGVVLLILLTSCTVSSNENSGFPLNNTDMKEDYDHFISITEIPGERILLGVEWTAFIEPFDYELSLGGLEITDIVWVVCDNQGNRNGEDEWYSITYIDKDLLEIVDQTFQFEATFNGKNYQSELRLTPELTCESVVEFWFEEDLEISWEAAYEPQLYNLYLYHHWFGELGYGNNLYDYQLSGDVTGYTLKHSLYYVEEANGYEALDASLQAINYYSKKEFLIYTCTEKEITYDNMVDK